jgi:hypothetical protein
MSDFTFACKQCGLSQEPCHHYLQHETIRLLKEDLRFNRMSLCEIIIRLEKLESAILKAIEGMCHRPSGLKIVGVGENNMSTPAGGTSVFQEVPTPAGSVFPTGTTFAWTVDDTADITLTPSSDTTQCTAVCVASPTGTAYNLTCTSSYTPPGATTPISATINVPIVAPPPTTPTGMVINQLS